MILYDYNTNYYNIVNISISNISIWYEKHIQF